MTQTDSLSRKIAEPRLIYKKDVCCMVQNTFVFSDGRVFAQVLRYGLTPEREREIRKHTFDWILIGRPSERAALSGLGVK